MIHIGFTGTSKGMTFEQKQVLRNMLIPFRNAFFHHGDCVGADAEAHDIAIDAGLSPIIHPPSNPHKRAFCVAQEIRMKKPYLVRNFDIVLDTSILFAAPAERKEQLRSGTWTTVRYARTRNRTIHIIYPLGEVMSQLRV